MVFPQTSVSIRFLEREAGALPKSSSFDAPPQHNHLFFAPPPLGDLTHLQKRKVFGTFSCSQLFPLFHISSAAAGFFLKKGGKRNGFPIFSHRVIRYRASSVSSCKKREGSIETKLYAKTEKNGCRKDFSQKIYVWQNCSVRLNLLCRRPWSSHENLVIFYT